MTLSWRAFVLSAGGWEDESTFVITVLDVTGAGRPLFTGACVKVENSADNSTQFEDACHFTRLLITDDPAYAPLAFLSATSELRSLSPSNMSAAAALAPRRGRFS